MSLRNIFTRSLDIAIDGVIKADDESSLRQELEEYVLTNEAAKRLSDFLDEYNNYQFANGVWISGFFGSGKSHLLKMLALVLENRQVDDAQALDLFLPKCKDDALLTGALRKAVSIPSQSILFNIDQKADVIFTWISSRPIRILPVRLGKRVESRLCLKVTTLPKRTAKSLVRMMLLERLSSANIGISTAYQSKILPTK